MLRPGARFAGFSAVMGSSAELPPASPRLGPHFSHHLCPSEGRTDSNRSKQREQRIRASVSLFSPLPPVQNVLKSGAHVLSAAKLAWCAAPRTLSAAPGRPSAALRTLSAPCFSPSAALRTPSAALRKLSAGLRTPSTALRTLPATLRTLSAALRAPSAALRTLSAALRALSAGLRTLSVDHFRCQ